MKDRFKFRAWIPEAKHLRSEAKDGMFYQEDQYLYSFIRRIQDQFVVNHPSYLPFELEERLMQCTGLKDKNGQLIYEGDIVNILNPTTSKKPTTCEIKYNESIASFEGFSELPFSLFLQNHDAEEKLNHNILKSGRTIEVIGNIHENPELLTNNNPKEGEQQESNMKEGFVYKLFKDNKHVGYESFHKELKCNVYTNLNGSRDSLLIIHNSFEIVPEQELIKIHQNYINALREDKNYLFGGDKEQHTAKIKAGLETAKKKGKKLGRPKVGKIKGEDEVVELYKYKKNPYDVNCGLKMQPLVGSSSMTYQWIADEVEISKSTVQKIINKYKKENDI